MDSAIETVLHQYDERAAGEMKRMQELPPAEFTKRIDEFLLAGRTGYRSVDEPPHQGSEGAQHP
jgi:hypothetical protein